MSDNVDMSIPKGAYHLRGTVPGMPQPGPICLMGQVLIDDDPARLEAFITRWCPSAVVRVAESERNRDDWGWGGTVTVDEAEAEIAELGLVAPLLPLL